MSHIHSCIVLLYNESQFPVKLKPTYTLLSMHYIPCIHVGLYVATCSLVDFQVSITPSFLQCAVLDKVFHCVTKHRMHIQPISISTPHVMCGLASCVLHLVSCVLRDCCYRAITPPSLPLPPCHCFNGPNTAIRPPLVFDKTINESASDSVFCISNAAPTPRFQWMYEGAVVSNHSLLVLSNVQRTQAGVYTCVTTNVIGTASRNITLTVQCKLRGIHRKRKGGAHGLRKGGEGGKVVGCH